MILDIIKYGHGTLREKCSPIEHNTPEIQKLIDNMWESMYRFQGQGLAASQVDRSLQLFIVDNKQVYEQMGKGRDEYFQGDTGIIETFINPRLIELSDETWESLEGCLSIPGISVNVNRSWSIEIEYLNRDFKLQRKVLNGMTAKVFQHEYDHTKGVLYIDHLSPPILNSLSERLVELAGKYISRYE